jgi:hypothetical protein
MIDILKNLSKEVKVVIAGIVLVFSLILTSIILKVDFSPNYEKEYIEQNAILKTKLKEQEEKLIYNQYIIDSLTKIERHSEKVVETKKNNLNKIKPKYDVKVKTITTSPADTISKFLTNRHSL